MSSLRPLDLAETLCNDFKTLFEMFSNLPSGWRAGLGILKLSDLNFMNLSTRDGEPKEPDKNRTIFERRMEEILSSRMLNVADKAL